MSSPDWRPAFGAWSDAGGVRFRVWAPAATKLELLLEPAGGGPAPPATPLAKDAEGIFSGWIAGAGPGDRYRYRLDGEGPFPDPASRFQPEGVHGPSEIVDAAGFAWSDRDWLNGGSLPPEPLILYELHVGTFTPMGTFAEVVERLPYLRDLGITAIEVMPVADFPGRYNWGYDGVCPYAPARCYGRPDELRGLVDAAHEVGLAVFLDVVYNHLGPDGAYLGRFSPTFFSDRHRSPWGAGVNLDGPGSAVVRRWLIDNALHWIHEYHMDGLRLDATHALEDDSPRHFVAELAARMHAARRGRRVRVIAEDHRNLAQMLKPEDEGGWNLDGVWADDFHHQVRRLLAGDHEGYYQDFSGSTEDLAATVQQGWCFTGQYSSYLKKPRGTDPSGIPSDRFVIGIQNHDQIGNRALGDRLTASVSAPAYRAATALLLVAPQTPLLFMGQEWGTRTPFLYFTDHFEDLGRQVTHGRREEFRHFATFSDAASAERVPDPQDEATFAASRLDWSEHEQPEHAAMIRLYRALLALRRREPALRSGPEARFRARAVDADTLLLARRTPGAVGICAVIRLRGFGRVELPAVAPAGSPDDLLSGPPSRWTLVLSTEDAAFSLEPAAPEIAASSTGLAIRFACPAAVIFRTTST